MAFRLHGARIARKRLAVCKEVSSSRCSKWRERKKIRDENNCCYRQTEPLISGDELNFHLVGAADFVAQ